MTYKRGGESNHNVLPSVALDVAFVLADGSWSGLLLSKFAQLVKAADARMHWGRDRPHFEVQGPNEASGPSCPLASFRLRCKA